MKKKKSDGLDNYKNFNAQMTSIMIAYPLYSSSIAYPLRSTLDAMFDLSITTKKIKFRESKNSSIKQSNSDTTGISDGFSDELKCVSKSRVTKYL
jgi:hypothetical protein